MNEAQQDALSNLTKLLIGAGAVGVAGRAAFGVKDMLSDNSEPEPTPEQPEVLNIPYRPRKLLQSKLLPHTKLATGPLGILGKWVGSEATDSSQIPATTLASILGTPAAAYLGWRGTDALLNHRRRTQLQQQLDDEKKNLADAERSSLEPRELPNLKTASDALQKLLDSPALNALAEKFASGGIVDTLYNWVPEDVKRYAPAIMAASAIPSAVMAYNYSRNSDPEYLKAKAIEKQIKEDRLSRGPNLIAKMTPVDDDGQPLPPEEQARLKQNDRLAKTAAHDLEGRARRFVDSLLGR